MNPIGWLTKALAVLGTAAGMLGGVLAFLRSPALWVLENVVLGTFLYGRWAWFAGGAAAVVVVYEVERLLAAVAALYHRLAGWL